MDFKVDGCESVHELMRRTQLISLQVGQNPTHIVLSTALADCLVWEVFGDDYSDEFPAYKKAIGSIFNGLKVLVVSNKSHDFIELLEVE